MSGSLVNAVGFNKAEKIIYKAQVFSSEKALDIGIIHNVVPKEDVMQVVHEEMTKRLATKGISTNLLRKSKSLRNSA